MPVTRIRLLVLRGQIMAGYLKSKSFSHEKAQIKDLWLKAAVINYEDCN